MNEYNNNGQNDNNNNGSYSEVSYYPNNDNSNSNSSANEVNGGIHEDHSKSKTKSKAVLKVLGFLCCMALVSATSVGIYKSYYSQPNSGAISSSVSANGKEDGHTNADQPTNDDKQDTTNSSTNDTSNSDSNGGVKAEQTSLFGIVDGGSDLTPAEIYSKVQPSVVGISATVEQQVSNSNDIYSYFFGYGNGGESQTQTYTSTGTGIVMTADGYILTNAHVVDGATEVTVMLNDDSEENEYKATVIGSDTSADIAVLKIQANNLTPAEFGDSDKLVVGDYAYAIGNPLGFDLANTFTPGIISGLNRTVTINENEMNLIQTSAAINSGNSGGPLVNSKGQVIGIVSSKISSSYYSSNSASVEGLGFAIPITNAQKIIDDLVTYGYVTGRPQLGITAEDITETMARYYNVPVGVYIRFMETDGAAAEAGMQVGDIITGVNGETISTYEDLSSKLKQFNAGDTIKVTFYRNNEEMTVDVTLHEKTAKDSNTITESN